MLARDIWAIAVDYDRTLTGVDLQPVPRALAALERARAAGRRVIVVSGRSLPFLRRAVARAADAIVAENGCLLAVGDAPATRTPGALVDLSGVIDALGSEGERGEVIASTAIGREPLLREAIARAGLKVDLVRNRDRVMLLPRGIDKAVGLLAALRALDVDPSRAAAAGDGENDLPMLRAVGYAIAVANAVDAVKEAADVVTTSSGGEGIAEWIERAWPVREARA